MVCLEECVDMRVAMYGILLLRIKPPALNMFKQTENELGWVKLYAKLITKVINSFNEIITVKC